MTTIVFKDGFFAADSLVTSDGMVDGYTEKIKKSGNLFFGMAGNIDLYEEFEKFLKGEVFDKEAFKGENASIGAIVVNKETRSVIYYSKRLVPEPVIFGFHAIGSGNEIARGAMLMGASAKKAVEMALKLDINSGGKIQVVKVW